MRPRFFVYCRKSTEAEDRQVLSIPSQTDEIHALARRLGLTNLEVITEARSAKAPGRPAFNEMMRRLDAGEADGILCWKLDRLARNPVDGGALIWAVRQHGIRIVTPTQAYSREDDNIILMYVELGIAHKYVDDLSRVVRRGLTAKAKRGWLPSAAPLGYLNRVDPVTKQTDIVRDPQRFPLLRKMWELMLSGNYSIAKIRAIANQQWGFRTRSGKVLPHSTLHYMFTNPFYSGSFEYPLRTGHWFRGRHEAMVTETEYDRVQALFGARGRPRAVTRSFAYTGLIRCGRCHAMVTAEEKHQLICPVCRLKFAYRSRDRCPRCHTLIEKMAGATRAPVFLRYVYYHCTGRKDPNCDERAVRVEHLEAGLAAYLERVQVSEAFQRWVVYQLQLGFAEDRTATSAIRATREKSYKACLARLENLVRLKTAPENGDGSLLSDEEYAGQRTALLTEKSRLGELVSDGGGPVTDWSTLVTEVFDFTSQARVWLSDRDPETRRLLLAVFAMDGSNLTLSRKRLEINAPKPFPSLAELLPSLATEQSRFEPATRRLSNARYGRSLRDFFPNLGDLEDARTYGEGGLRLVGALRAWLLETPRAELLGLQTRLRALFKKAGETDTAASPR